MRPDLNRRKGQSIFEYFILTIVVVSVALFFMKTKAYQNINSTTETAFNQAVDKITSNSITTGPASSTESQSSSSISSSEAQDKLGNTIEAVSETAGVQGLVDSMSGKKNEKLY
jgi:hypothetical protein